MLRTILIRRVFDITSIQNHNRSKQLPAKFKSISRAILPKKKKTTTFKIEYLILYVLFYPRFCTNSNIHAYIYNWKTSPLVIEIKK